MFNITLKQLEIFIAVAHKLSFSAAAEYLYLTQPAISKQIRNLEEQCGGETLFEQIGKKIHLTEHGKLLLKHAEQVLQTVRNLKDSVDHSRGLIKGKLRIGMTDTLQQIIFMAIADFRKQYPHVQFTIEINHHEILLNYLEENKLDFALMGNASHRLNCLEECIINLPLTLAASSQHPLAKKKKITLSDLKNETFIVGDRDTVNYKTTYKLLNQLDDPEQHFFQVTNFAAIKNAVKANLGIAILGKFFVISELKTGNLVELNYSNLPKMNFGIFWMQHKEKLLSKAGNLFKEAIFKEIKTLSN